MHYTYLMKKDRIVLSEHAISQITDSIAKRINWDYQSLDRPVVFICVLRGAFMFFSDLMKKINIDCTVEFMKIKSYDNNKSNDSPIIEYGPTNLKDKWVIVVEDIVDSGVTIKTINRFINKQKPFGLAICSLISRKDDNPDIDYAGWIIPSGFIYGYGLDNKEKQRNLSDIYIINQQLKTNSHVTKRKPD